MCPKKGLLNNELCWFDIRFVDDLGFIDPYMLSSVHFQPVRAIVRSAARTPLSATRTSVIAGTTVTLAACVKVCALGKLGQTGLCGCCKTMDISFGVFH